MPLILLLSSAASSVVALPMLIAAASMAFLEVLALLSARDALRLAQLCVNRVDHLVEHGVGEYVRYLGQVLFHASRARPVQLLLSEPASEEVL